MNNWNTPDETGTPAEDTGAAEGVETPPTEEGGDLASTPMPEEGATEEVGTEEEVVGGGEATETPPAEDADQV